LHLALLIMRTYVAYVLDYFLERSGSSINKVETQIDNTVLIQGRTIMIEGKAFGAFCTEQAVRMNEHQLNASNKRMRKAKLIISDAP
jgi:hypothetical protein